MKKVFPLLIILFICSCSPKHPLVGKWEATHYSYWERAIAYLKGVKMVAYGPQLDINSDSTFKKTDCGSFYFGKWRIKGDSLILSNDTIVWRDNQHRILEQGGIAGEPIKYKYQSSYLIGRNKLTHYSKGVFYNIERDSRDSLKYVNPHESYSMLILKPAE